MNRLSQLKSAPVSVFRTNLAKCGDTVIVAFCIGLFFFGIEVYAARHGLDPRFVTPFSEVVKSQLDLLSVALFFAVVVFFAGSHLILANVGFARSAMDFLGIPEKMDVFYLFVLQYIAAAVGVRAGMTALDLISGIDCRPGLRPMAILAVAELTLIGLWYVKEIPGKTKAFPLGILLILFAAVLYLSLAFPAFRGFVGA
jgi:hypothetical protein